jgi:RNA polymerase sigma factor (sigma-70 family)
LERGISKDFARQLLGCLNTAHQLARQLTRNAHDAEDVVQEAYLRALRSASGFRGGNARPWLLRIVRNVFYTSVRRNSGSTRVSQGQVVRSWHTEFRSAERALLRRAIVHHALETLPAHCREVLVLREVEEMSYKDISAVLGVPKGTVMSRLARARARLRESAWLNETSGKHDRA